MVILELSKIKTKKKKDYFDQVRGNVINDIKGGISAESQKDGIRLKVYQKRKMTWWN